MAGKADIVFCLDASASMMPCIEGVRRHLGTFLDVLGAGGQSPFRCRLDFVAHCAGEGAGGLFYQRSVYNPNLLDALYGGCGQGRFFTEDPEEFRSALGQVQVFGDEAPLVALDSCLDFPWSDDPRTHRVVILMTDEPFETGVCQEIQRARLAELKDKVRRLKALLFLVGPESDVFYELSAIDRSEYEVIDRQDDGLANVDFRQVLSSIGQSVSMSRLQAAALSEVPRGLFGQANWKPSSEQITGA